jgi:hypothetical protein
MKLIQILEGRFKIFARHSCFNYRMYEADEDLEKLASRVTCSEDCIHECRSSGSSSLYLSTEHEMARELRQ